MTDILTLTPTTASRLLIVLVFVLPLAAVPWIGFSSVLTGLFSGMLLLVGLKGLMLLVPGWNGVSWDGHEVVVRAGPGAPLRVPAERLEAAGEWTFFFLPTYAERPVLVWRDETGKRREKPLFHVYGSGLEETRRVLSGQAPAPGGARTTPQPGKAASDG